MKRAMLLFGMLASASLAMALDGASTDRGKQLFTSTQLGTSGKSCNSCHPGGKGLEKAASYGEVALGEIINQCITNPLKGKALDPKSAEMKSLIMYLKTQAPSARH